MNHAIRAIINRALGYRNFQGFRLKVLAEQGGSSSSHYSAKTPFSKWLKSTEAAVLELSNSPAAWACSICASRSERRTPTLSFGLDDKKGTARSGLGDTLLAVLAHQYLPVIVALLAMILTAPTLWYGWGIDDDMLQRTMLLSSSLPTALKELFVFLDPHTNRALMDVGALPWWTLETVRVSFLRPVAALSLWLDYQFWPQSAILMHAHNVLWYAGLCALAALVYRQFMGRNLSAGLAALLFAVNVTHFSAAASLNARNVLQTALFGLLTIGFHDRWRRDGWRAGVWLAPLCLALALLSAEAGIATLAYLAAYTICLDRGTWRWRLGSLVPYVVVLALWRLVYQSGGYGAWASDFYLDPGREPLRFAMAILERGPVLLLSQWTLPDPGTYAVLSTAARRVFWLVALLFIVFMGVMLVPLIRKSRVARFLGLGMMLAVVPICAVNPASGRHLVFVSLGALGLMAQLVAGLLKRPDWLPARRAWRILAWAVGLVLLGLHLVLFPILVSSAQTAIGPLYRAVMDIGSLPGIERQDVVIVNAPSPGQFIYLSSLRQFGGQPMPAHMRVLAPAHSPVEVSRLDAHTIIVQPEYGYLLSPGKSVGGRRDIFPLIHPSFASQYGDGFFRSGAFPMTLGQQVELTGMCAEVIALTPNGRPLEARMQFTVPLEDASLKWLQWDWERNTYVPFTLPAAGESVRVAGPF
jgi:hypothetical protein